MRSQAAWRLECGSETDFDLAVVRNGRLPVDGWHGDLPNAKVIALHRMGVHIPVVCWMVGRALSPSASHQKARTCCVVTH